MKWFRKYRLIFVGAAVGAAAGYLYYYFVGCASGSCAITSSPVNSTLYGAAFGGLLFNLLIHRTNKKQNNMDIQKILQEKQGTIVDVRTPEEFRGGHVRGSINIPLQQLQGRVDEIKRLAPPVILCCASGNRSGQAQGFLARQGIECANGGSWTNVQRLMV